LLKIEDENERTFYEKKGQIIEKATDAIKDHTVLEFLDLKDDERYS
jgi:predicted nuclease of restriction endonuclease-like (RecB) superfamily